MPAAARRGRALRRSPRPSGGSPRSTTCSATATARSPRGSTPPDSFAAAGLAGEAAAERLRVAGYRQSAGRHGDAVELAVAAADEATRAERTDLRARALGLEGVARAKRGEFEAGVETIRAGLSLALEHELTAEAAELYQRLATALESAADYGGAREALTRRSGCARRPARPVRSTRA